MDYDPIKNFLGGLFNRRLFTRRLFYRMLDIILLRAWHIHRELRLFARTKQAQQSLDVLDAGSGFGQYSYFLAKKFPAWNIQAVDIKEEEISTCRDTFSRMGLSNVRFDTCDLSTFTSAGSYDLILSVDVMEHIEQDEEVFSNFHTSLKPGGLLIINTPSDQGGSDVNQAGDTSFIGEHVRDGYSMDDIQAKLVRAGFTSVDMKYTYGKPGHISWKLSMKYPIKILNASRLFLIVLPIYYVFVMPVVYILNRADLRFHHKSGTGLLVKARKPL